MTKTDFDAHELLALARIDIERGAFEQALLKIKQLIAFPEVPDEAYALAGRLYAQLGLWNRSKELFQHYLQRQPHAVTEAFQLGMVHFDAGHLDEAGAIWLALLKKQATHPPALFYLALINAQQGKPTEARHYLDVLLKSAPADNLYFGRGKDLLHAIETQQPLTAPRAADNREAQIKESPRVVQKNPYKTEH